MHHSYTASPTDAGATAPAWAASRARYAGQQAPGTRPVTAGHPSGCACSVCAGLKPLTRPRFFAGQILYDTDLNDLERYVLDKNRLHNRHLHGWGVVCGLELVCDQCGDDVIVRPGYAIDPCGNDVIVGQAAVVGVLAAIEACRAAERSAPVCEPPSWTPPTSCPTDEHWCVTLRYRERPIRPVAPLAPATSTGCSCGGQSCGCSSGARPVSGYECTCGSGGSRNAATCGCTPPAASTNRPPGCEPSVISEEFELDVCRSDGSCGDLRQRLEGTMPMRIAHCVTELQKVINAHVGKSQQKQLLKISLGDSAAAGSANASDAICDMYTAVLELYTKDPLRTQCVLPKELDLVNCEPRAEGESAAGYRGRMEVSTQALVLLMVNYLRDCVCHALLPPCPTDPCDDRILLGCLTVRDGKVVDICNLDCRHYAGSFVTRNYWFPIGPVLGWAAAKLCCFPLVGRRFGTKRTDLFAGADPKRTWRSALMRNEYAAPRRWRSKAADLQDKLETRTLKATFDKGPSAVKRLIKRRLEDR